MSFYKALKSVYPSSIPLKTYLKELRRSLGSIGFNGDNTILCLSTCRDENTRPLVTGLQDGWGDAFNLGGLAGVLFCGRASLKAAINHAPVDELGVERYLFIGMTHIGITAEGEVGKFLRTNRAGKTGACGALVAIRDEIVNGNIPLEVNQLDMEMSLLRQKIVSELEFGYVPSLVDITELTREIIADDLERLTDTTVTSERFGTCMMLDCKYFESNDTTGTCLMLDQDSVRRNKEISKPVSSPTLGFSKSATPNSNSGVERTLYNVGLATDWSTDISILDLEQTGGDFHNNNKKESKEKEEEEETNLGFGICMMSGSKVGIDLKYQKVQYAFQSGIQVHGPGNENWIVPGKLYVNTDLSEGKRVVDMNYILE